MEAVRIRDTGIIGLTGHNDLLSEYTCYYSTFQKESQVYVQDFRKIHTVQWEKQLLYKLSGRVLEAFPLS